MRREELIETRVKDFIMNEIFHDRPFNNTDWDDFMADSNKIIDFQLCEAYEIEDVRGIRGLMEKRLEEQLKLQEDLEIKTVYIVSLYNIWFNDDSESIEGIFDSYERAEEFMFSEYGKDNLDENGSNQWTCGEKEYGLMIYSTPFNSAIYYNPYENEGV